MNLSSIICDNLKDKMVGWLFGEFFAKIFSMELWAYMMGIVL